CPVYLVCDTERAALLAEVPAIGIRACDRDLTAGVVERVDVVHVFCKVVQCVTARRRSAHSELECRARDIREGCLDLHPAMLWFRKREAVFDLSRRVKWRQPKE